MPKLPGSGADPTAGKQSTPPVHPLWQRAIARGALAAWCTGVMTAAFGCEAQRFVACPKETPGCATSTNALANPTDMGGVAFDPTPADAGGELTRADGSFVPAHTEVGGTQVEGPGAGTSSGEENGTKTSADVSYGETMSVNPVGSENAAETGSPAPSVAVEGTEGGPAVSSEAAVTEHDSSTGTNQVDGSSSSPGEPTPAPPSGENLVVNGDFSQGREGWSLDDDRWLSGVQSNATSGTLCLRAFSEQVVVGWPEDADDALELAAGTYEFSFRVQTSGARLWAKVGHAREPYDTFFEVAWEGDDGDWETVTRQFTLDGDDAVGVAFTIELDGERLCLDDVSLSFVGG